MQERNNYGQRGGNREPYGQGNYREDYRQSSHRWDDQSRDDEIAGAAYGDWDETSANRDLNRASAYTSSGGGYAGGGRRSENWRGNRDYPQMPYRGAYGGGYATRQGGGFQSFRPDDYGGADFTAQTSGTPYGGFGAHYSDDYGAGRSYRTEANEGRYGSRRYDNHRHDERRYGTQAYRGYDERDERGFMDRASDEVASWFGDEDAARRRQMDHTGRGPSNYSRSDDRIREDVCDRLTDDWQVDASEVNVSVASAEVTLDGTVDSRAAKRRAEDCAERVSGVRHVQNNLRVRQQDSTTSALGTSDASRMGKTATH